MKKIIFAISVVFLTACAEDKKVAVITEPVPQCTAEYHEFHNGSTRMFEFKSFWANCSGQLGHSRVFCRYRGGR